MHKALHAGIHDGLGLGHGGPPVGLPGLHHPGKVVYGVQIDIVQGFDFRLNVARYGQIDHEHRPAPAPLQGPLHRAKPDDRQGAGSAADNRIKLMQPLWHFGQVHHLAAKAAGQLFPALQGAVGNHHALGCFGCKVGGTQINHVARAHKQDIDLAQVFKQLTRQPHRRRRHADRVRADFGRAAHLLGDCKGALEHLAQGAAQGTSGLGGAYRIFELAQYLRLAQNHGVQSACHPKCVARSEPILQGVGVGSQGGWRNAAGFCQPGQRAFKLGLLAGAVNFRAVAGGDQGRFGGSDQSPAQRQQGGFNLFNRKGEATT